MPFSPLAFPILFPHDWMSGWRGSSPLHLPSVQFFSLSRGRSSPFVHFPVSHICFSFCTLERTVLRNLSFKINQWAQDKSVFSWVQSLMSACQADPWANWSQFTEVQNHYSTTWISHFSQDYKPHHHTAIVAKAGFDLYVPSHLFLIHE